MQFVELALNSRSLRILQARFIIRCFHVFQWFQETAVMSFPDEFHENYSSNQLYLVFPSA